MPKANQTNQSHPSQEIAQTVQKDIEDSSIGKIILTIFLLILLFGSTALIAYLTSKIRSAKPVNFEECAKLESSTITEGNPSICTTKDGLKFTQQTSENEKSLEFNLDNKKDEIDTSDWEIYTNEEYNFSFKHPNLSELCCETPYPSATATKVIELAEKLAVGQFEGGAPPMNGLEIYIDNNQEENLEKYIETQKQLMLDSYSGKSGNVNTDSRITNKVNIAEQTSFRLQGFPFWRDISFIPFPKGNKILIINKTDVNINFEETYNQILSTFKFLDKETENVQGIQTTSCLETNQQILEEISECEQIDEVKCQTLKEAFNECTTSCQKELGGKNECFDICKPVCKTNYSND